MSEYRKKKNNIFSEERESESDFFGNGCAGVGAMAVCAVAKAENFEQGKM